METLKKLVETQCKCGSRALGKGGNFRFVNQLKQYLEDYHISYTIEENEYRYFKALEGNIILNGIAYYAKTFAGVPPFFPYEYSGTFVYIKDEEFCLSEVEEIHIEILESRENLLEKIERVLGRNKIEAIIFVLPKTRENQLIDIVLPLSEIKADIIKEFRRIPILAISEETWDAIRYKRQKRLEVIQNSYMDSITHENLIVELGSQKNIVCICSHIDSAFERADIDGANDNASGVAVLMKLTLELSQIKDLKKGVKIVFYNGEEYNMIGCVNMLMDTRTYFLNHNYEDLFNMINSGNLKKHLTLEAEEVIEIDVVGEGQILNIYTNESTEELLNLLPYLNINKIEKIFLHNGGGSLNYILSMAGSRIKQHFSQLSDMRYIIHTTNDNISNVDRGSLDIYYDYLVSYVKTRICL